MRNPNLSSAAPENQGGFLQKIAGRGRGLMLMALLGIGGQSVVACGTAENRDNNNAPRQSLNGLSTQVEFPFGVTAEAADEKLHSDSVTTSTNENGKVVDIQATTLDLPKAGSWSFIAYPKANCENGDRPAPATYSKAVNPGVNAPVNVVFDTEACTLGFQEGECEATPENGRPDLDGDGLTDACDSIDNRPVTDTTDNDFDNDGVPDAADECPQDPLDECTLPQGRIEIGVQEPVAGVYSPSQGAQVRIDEPGATGPRTATSDAQGDTSFEHAECGVNITRTVSKASFQTEVKAIQIPCTGDKTYRNEVFLQTNPNANALIWDRTSYAADHPTNSCVNTSQMLHTTDANGVMNSAPYAGPVTFYSNTPTAVTVDPNTGVACVQSPTASADVTATTGAQTTPPLRVIGY